MAIPRKEKAKSAIFFQKRGASQEGGREFL